MLFKLTIAIRDTLSREVAFQKINTVAAKLTIPGFHNHFTLVKQDVNISHIIYLYNMLPYRF